MPIDQVKKGTVVYFVEGAAVTPFVYLGGTKGRRARLLALDASGITRKIDGWRMHDLYPSATAAIEAAIKKVKDQIERQRSAIRRDEASLEHLESGNCRASLADRVGGWLMAHPEGHRGPR